MALTTKTFSESNLRVLMTAFYQSSRRARDLHEDIQQHSLPAAEINSGVAVDPNGSSGLLLSDTKARFFAHLIEFAQHLRRTIHSGITPATYPLSKQFSFAPPAQNGDFPILQEMIRSSFSQLIRDLRDDDVRALILAQYTPKILQAEADAAAHAASISSATFLAEPTEITLSPTVLMPNQHLH